MSAAENERRAKLLIIGPGTGFVANPAKLEALREAFDVSFPWLPEPSDDDAIADIVDKLLAVIDGAHDDPFDLLVAGSRGAAAMSALLGRRQCGVPVLLLAGCDRLGSIVPAWRLELRPVVERRQRLDDVQLSLGPTVTLYHGTCDEVFLYADVVDEARAFANVRLLAAAGDSHVLPSLTPDQLVQLCRRAMQPLDQRQLTDDDRLQADRARQRVLNRLVARLSLESAVLAHRETDAVEPIGPAEHCQCHLFQQ